MNKKIMDTIKNHVTLDSDYLIKEDIQKIEFGGMTIFEKHPNFFDSKLFGIDIKTIGIIGAIIWLLQKK